MNFESAPSENKDNTTQSGWDELAKMAKDFNRQQAESIADAAASFYRAALGVERDFNDRIKSLKEAGGKMDKKEFEKWEDAMSDELKYADIEFSKTNPSLEIMAEGEQAMIFTLNRAGMDDTIEVEAGKYYIERMNALHDAIKAAGNQEDLDYTENFYNAVVDHLEFRYMTADEVREYGFKEYEADRTRAHNNAIKGLNGINNLAKKYHVRPFTVRNFCPSDVRDKNRQTAPVARVMRYDRDMVEAYYSVAFSTEIEHIQKSHEAKERLFR